MLEQRAEWGSMDSIQLLVFHIGHFQCYSSYVQNPAAQSYLGNNNAIITLVKGQKVGQHIFRQHHKERRLQSKVRVITNSASYARVN